METNFFAIKCDLVVHATFEINNTWTKDTVVHNTPYALGEVWADTVDPTVFPFGGYMDYVIRETGPKN